MTTPPLDWRNAGFVGVPPGFPDRDDVAHRVVRVWEHTGAAPTTMSDPRPGRVGQAIPAREVHHRPACAKDDPDAPDLFEVTPLWAEHLGAVWCTNAGCAR